MEKFNKAVISIRIYFFKIRETTTLEQCENEMSRGEKKYKILMQLENWFFFSLNLILISQKYAFVI